MPNTYGENREPVPAIDAPTVIFIITNSLGTHGSGEQGVYNATRTGWIVGPRIRDNAVYALGAANGVIHGAYWIDRWTPVEDEPGRWAFDGPPAPELANVVGTSIARLRRAQGSAFMYFPEGIPEENQS